MSARKSAKTTSQTKAIAANHENARDGAKIAKIMALSGEAKKPAAVAHPVNPWEDPHLLRLKRGTHSPQHAETTYPSLTAGTNLFKIEHHTANGGSMRRALAPAPGRSAGAGADGQLSSAPIRSGRRWRRVSPVWTQTPPAPASARPASRSAVAVRFPIPHQRMALGQHAAAAVGRFNPIADCKGDRRKAHASAPITCRPWCAWRRSVLDAGQAIGASGGGGADDLAGSVMATATCRVARAGQQQGSRRPQPR